MTRQKEQEDQAEKTREEIGKGNQMTALRFQTGEKHQTSLTYLRGRGEWIQQKLEKKERATGLGSKVREKIGMGIKGQP